MLKASSLLYAIFICFIIAILCGSIILIASLNIKIEAKYSLKEELLITNTSIFNYYLNTVDIKEMNLPKDYLNNGIISNFGYKKWGLFNLIVGKSYINKDTVFKVGLVGVQRKKENLGLYVTDNDKTLHLSGTAKIKGDIRISKFGIDYKKLGNSKVSRGEFFEGTLRPSLKKLPKISNFVLSNEVIGVYSNNILEYNSGLVKERSHFKPTLIVDATSQSNINEIKLSGNIILKSEDSIFISKTAILEDIIIDAPVVVFETGFIGTVQVFAKNDVSLQKDVKLKYPSVIFINSDSTNKTSINIAEDCIVIGGIILTGKTQNEAKNRILNIDVNANIIGDVYCFGKTQLKGTIIGTLFTDSFYLETSSAKYDNFILHGNIDAFGLPENFIRIPLFENSELLKYELIKCI